MGLFSALKSRAVLSRLVVSEEEIVAWIKKATESEEANKSLETKLGVVIGLKAGVAVLSAKEMISEKCVSECTEILEKWLKS